MTRSAPRASSPARACGVDAGVVDQVVQAPVQPIASSTTRATSPRGESAPAARTPWPWPRGPCRPAPRGVSRSQTRSRRRPRPAAARSRPDAHGPARDQGGPAAQVEHVRDRRVLAHRCLPVVVSSARDRGSACAGAMVHPYDPAAAGTGSHNGPLEHLGSRDPRPFPVIRPAVRWCWLGSWPSILTRGGTRPTAPSCPARDRRSRSRNGWIWGFSTSGTGSSAEACRHEVDLERRLAPTSTSASTTCSTTPGRPSTTTWRCAGSPGGPADDTGAGARGHGPEIDVLARVLATFHGACHRGRTWTVPAGIRLIPGSPPRSSAIRPSVHDSKKRPGGTPLPCRTSRPRGCPPRPASVPQAATSVVLRCSRPTSDLGSDLMFVPSARGRRGARGPRPRRARAPCAGRAAVRRHGRRDGSRIELVLDPRPDVLGRCRRGPHDDRERAVGARVQGLGSSHLGTLSLLVGGRPRQASLSIDSSGGCMALNIDVPPELFRGNVARGTAAWP